ncbi:MAG TPA: copper chaperone PCu(A)C [Xanthomonadaceae bacterium]
MNVHACRIAVLVALVFASAAGSGAAPAAGKPCQPVVRDAWVRLPPGNMPMMAGFGRIENRCGMPATVVRASSPSFASVELHETKLVDGVNRMRPVPELRLAPNGAAVLKPGGLHLMLMKPSAPLSPGSRVVLQFELAGGGKVLGEFEVRKAVP